MTQNRANPYLKTKILTATAEELRLMLYDGAVRFCRQGQEALEREDREASFESLMRAQKIVLELSTSLNHQVAPELCEKLSALYTYIYKLLVDANVDRDSAKVAQAIELLNYERETWQMLMKKLAAEAGAQDGRSSDDTNVAGAQQTAISSLSVDG